jgi:hypothetical protein
MREILKLVNFYVKCCIYGFNFAYIKLVFTKKRRLKTQEKSFCAIKHWKYMNFVLKFAYFGLILQKTDW